jgi:hypothetical protein
LSRAGGTDCERGKEKGCEKEDEKAGKKGYG